MCIVRGKCIVEKDGLEYGLMLIYTLLTGLHVVEKLLANYIYDEYFMD